MPPEIRTVHGREPLRQHADDGVGLAAENELTADRGGIGGELAAPERFAHDDDALPVVAGMKQTAEYGVHPEKREEARGHVGPAQPLGGAESGQRQVGAVGCRVRSRCLRSESIGE